MSRDFSAIAQQFSERVRKGRPHSDDVLTAIGRLANVGDRLASRARELDGDRDLTATGRANALANSVTKGLVKDFAQASERPRKALGHLNAQKAGMSIPVMEKGDLVEAMRRMEIRSHVVALPLEKRVAAMLDPDMRVAVFDAPASLSGIPAEHFNQAKTAFIREINGEKFAEIEGALEDYAAASAIATMVQDQLANSSGLSRGAFDILMTGFEQETNR